MSTMSTDKDLLIPDCDVSSYVLARAEEFGDRAAMIDGVSGQCLTYRVLNERVTGLASGLTGLGFGQGQVLALMAPNCPDFAVVFHGAVLAGGAVTTINPNYTAAEVHHQLIDSTATIAVVDGECMQVFEEASKGTAIRRIIGLGRRAGEHPALEMIVGNPALRALAIDPGTVAALPYSSGTTGLSKGVMLTHRNLVANLEQTAPRLNLVPGEVIVAALPLFHIYGMNTIMNPALRAGCTIVTMPRFELKGFLQLSEKHRTRRCFVVPPIALALASDPEVDNYDLSAMETIISGAAPLSAELSSRCSARLCCTVAQGYGMTELSPVSHFSSAANTPAGSVGLVVDGTEVRITDPGTGQDQPTGVDGELWIRGPQVMKGYLNNEAATRTTITSDGWLRTGDIARQDLEGNLYVVDRLKELIKFKGFQIAPAEVEAALLSHPDVADAAVIGRPDSEAGELPVGFIVARPGPLPSVETLKWHMSKKLASYKRLHELHFVDAIPKSPSGKVLRRVLRERLPPVDALPRG